jgi:tetratricopeptide (TPR) repeat protein
MQIRQEPPAVREAMILAIHDWAFGIAGSGNPDAELLIRAILKIEVKADDDLWRKNFRDAVTKDSLQVFQKLSADARKLQLAPSSLFSLAESLGRRGDRDGALELLRWAQWRHPTDFWIVFGLGSLFEPKNPEQSVDLEERIGSLRTALVLRPDASVVHYNLGIALIAKKQLDDAIFEFNQAIKFDSHYAPPHVMLGNCLKAMNRLDEAIDEYKKAITIDPKRSVAHFNLGITLMAKKRLDEAIDVYKTFVKLEPNDALGWLNLGAALFDTNRVDESIEAYRAAIAINPNLANGHAALGLAFLRKGQFVEAKTSTQQALKFLPENHRARPRILNQLAQCDTFLALEAKLSNVLADKAQVQDNGERRGFIEICRFQQRYAAAAKLSRDAFAADPKLADDLIAAHRYNAACFAILAAAGQGTDVDKLDDRERAHLRKQSLDWLKADLDLWEKRLAEGKPADQKLVLDTLRHWQNDPDLASVREAASLGKLLTPEREAWRELWAAVAKVCAACSPR